MDCAKFSSYVLGVLVGLLTVRVGMFLSLSLVLEASFSYLVTLSSLDIKFSALSYETSSFLKVKAERTDFDKKGCVCRVWSAWSGVMGKCGQEVLYERIIKLKI